MSRMASRLARFFGSGSKNSLMVLLAASFGGGPSIWGAKAKWSRTSLSWRIALIGRIWALASSAHAAMSIRAALRAAVAFLLFFLSLADSAGPKGAGLGEPSASRPNQNWRMTYNAMLCRFFPCSARASTDRQNAGSDSWTPNARMVEGRRLMDEESRQAIETGSPNVPGPAP